MKKNIPGKKSLQIFNEEQKAIDSLSSYRCTFKEGHRAIVGERDCRIARLAECLPFGAENRP